jgi:putative flippase GtrA
MTVLLRLAADRRIRYVAAGGLSAAVYYGLFAAGWLTLSRWVPYLAVSVLASTLTAVLTYPVYRCVVFRTGGGVLSGFFRFYLVCVWALLFSLGGLWALVDGIGVNVLLAQAIIILVGPLINYQAGRRWAFRPQVRTD